MWRQCSLFCAHPLMPTLPPTYPTQDCNYPFMPIPFSVRGICSHVIFIFASSVLDPDCELEKWFMLKRTVLGTWLRGKQEMYIEKVGKIALWFLPCYLRAAHARTSPGPLCASVSSPVKWGVSKAPRQRAAGGLTGIVCAECFQGQLVCNSRTQ